MAEVPEDLVTDLFGFAAPSEGQLANISTFAKKALELKAQIEQAKEYLKQLEKELNIIETIDLAKIMKEAGMEEFTLTGGGKIKMKHVVGNGLSKVPEQRQATFDWVVEAGGAEIIKDHFEIDYTKGRYDEAIVFRKLLQANNISFDEFESIHVQTLWAFCREKLAEMDEGKGEMPPFDEMGLYYAKHAEVSPPKEKKKKNED